MPRLLDSWVSQGSVLGPLFARFVKADVNGDGDTNKLTLVRSQEAIVTNS